MRHQRPWLAVLALVAVAVAGALVDWKTFLQSWMAATLTWAALPLGAMVVLMTHGLTGGRWGSHSQPVWRALTSTLPLFLVTLLPLLLVLDGLFAWTSPAEDLPEVVQNKLLYLNEPFFIVRALVFALIWLGVAWFLGIWRGCGQRRIHAPGLLLWLLALTFFSFDWFMSLEPKFYSDVYGLMLAAGFISAALAGGLVLGVARLEGRVRRDIANLWLSVLIGWAFLAFSQYIIIWSANLPDEIGWYLHRRAGVWPWVSVLSFILFFLVPFAILLSSSAKGQGRWLLTAATSCLVGHVLQVHWLVLPAFGHGQPMQIWLIPGLVVTLGLSYVGVINRYDSGYRGGTYGGKCGEKERGHV